MRIRSEKNSARALDCTARINRAIDFILQHLDQPLPLGTVAKAACFSPFHFHRMFRLRVGESLLAFVKRVRLERALALLSRNTWARARPRSLTDIAFECGFRSAADFCRCFKQHYGVAPSRFDVQAFRKRQRQQWETIAAPERHRLERLPPASNSDGFAVRLRRLRPRRVAYLRVPNSFREGAVPDAARRLIRWAENRGFADGQWLGYMWDDPEIVAPRDCRYDVAVEVSSFAASDDIGCLQFPPMLVAEVEIRGSLDLEMRALDWLFGSWLPGSGYVPTDQPCFEAWIGRPFAHGLEYFELRIQVPVECA